MRRGLNTSEAKQSRGRISVTGPAHRVVSVGKAPKRRRPDAGSVPAISDPKKPLSPAGAAAAREKESA